MYKIFGSLIFIMSYVCTTAQTDKGDWITGGSLYLASTANEGITTGDTLISSGNNFSITAFGGYFIAQQLCVGAGISYGRNTFTNNYAPVELTDISTTFTIELISRYYYWNREYFKLWAGLGIRKGFGNYADHYYLLDEQGNGTTAVFNDEIQTLSIGFGPGASVMLTDKLALELYYGSIGYSTYSLKRDDGSYDYTTNSFGISLANTFGFGMTYHFSNNN